MKMKYNPYSQIKRRISEEVLGATTTILDMLTRSKQSRIDPELSLEIEKELYQIRRNLNDS